MLNRERHAFGWQHEGDVSGGPLDRMRYQAALLRVSDDGWWRDFPNASRGLTPRLLPTRLGVEYDLALPDGEAMLYARSQHWQVLQGSGGADIGAGSGVSSDVITSPTSAAHSLGCVAVAAGRRVCSGRPRANSTASPCPGVTARSIGAAKARAGMPWRASAGPGASRVGGCCRNGR